MKIQSSQITQKNTALENYNANGKKDTRQELRTLAEIQNWLVCYLAEQLLIEANEIDISIPFDRYGLDSATAIGLTGDLEDWLAIELDPTLIYDYPSVEALSQHLAKQLNTEDLNYSHSN